MSDPDTRDLIAAREYLYGFREHWDTDQEDDDLGASSLFRVAEWIDAEVKRRETGSS